MPDLAFHLGEANFSQAAGPAGMSYPPRRMPGMTEQTTHQHHAIDYIEITVGDLEAAKRFYGEAFGWQFNDYGPGYAGIRRGAGEAGGLRAGEAVGVGGPLVLLFSSDLDASVE